MNYFGIPIMSSSAGTVPDMSPFLALQQLRQQAQQTFQEQQRLREQFAATQQQRESEYSRGMAADQQARQQSLGLQQAQFEESRRVKQEELGLRKQGMEQDQQRYEQEAAQREQILAKAEAEKAKQETEAKAQEEKGRKRTVVTNKISALADIYRAQQWDPGRMRTALLNHLAEQGFGLQDPEDWANARAEVERIVAAYQREMDTELDRQDQRSRMEARETPKPVKQEGLSPSSKLTHWRMEKRDLEDKIEELQARYNVVNDPGTSERVRQMTLAEVGGAQRLEQLMQQYMAKMEELDARIAALMGAEPVYAG